MAVAQTGFNFFSETSNGKILKVNRITSRRWPNSSLLASNVHSCAEASATRLKSGCPKTSVAVTLPVESISTSAQQNLVHKPREQSRYEEQLREAEAAVTEAMVLRIPLPAKIRTIKAEGEASYGSNFIDISEGDRTPRLARN